jgi:hypothetical protein
MMKIKESKTYNAVDRRNDTITCLARDADMVPSVGEKSDRMVIIP